MNIRTLSLAGALAASTALAGCATTMDGQPYYSSSSARQYDNRNVGGQYVSYGTVESVRYVSLQRDEGIGAGAVLGAIVGGALGNQIGDGSGRTAATVGGALAGGYVGDKIQDNRNYEQGVEVVVRLDNGGRAAIVQNQDYRFYEGQRVKVVGTGSSARVAPF